MFEFIKNLVLQVITWIFDVLLWLPKTVFGFLMEGASEAFVYAADTVCVQACIAAVNGIQSGFSSIPPTVIYFADFFQIGYGFSLIICAYTARFIIRRIPFIG
jgi:hypothetical protein